MGVDVGTATGYLDLDISGFLSGLKTAQSEAQATASNMATKIGSGFQSVGQTLTSVGSTLTKSVTTPVVGLATAVVKTGADFESSMSKVQAISGASGNKLDALKEKAREMGAATKFSATEASEAFQYMAMAGWDTEDMLGGISGIMNLAAASGEDLASVSDIVTDAMTAFGLSAEGTSKVMKDGLELEVDNTTRFVDALAAASNSSNTNVSMLGESFKYVAPVAGALGYSVEDTAVALGLMANQGIKASQSGTALRTMLTNMANPTDAMANAMDTLGVSLQNEDGSMKSLMEVLTDLRSGFGGGKLDAEEFSKGMQELQTALDSGEITAAEYEMSINDLMIAMYGAEGAQKAQIASQLAGKEGMAGLLAIVNTGADDFDKLTKSIYNASGTSQEMADIMNNNLTGQITIMISMLQELALQIGDIILPVIKDVVTWLQELIARLQEMSPEQKEQIVRWAAIAAAIGPVILAVGKLICIIGKVITTLGNVPSIISQVKASFGLLGQGIASISAPVVAVIAVIGALVAAFKHLWDTNEDFRNSIIEIWIGIQSKFEEFVNGMSERLAALGIDFEEITSTLSAIWQGFCDFLAPVFEAAFSLLGNILGTALDLLTGIFDIFVGLFSGNWEQLWNGIQEVFGAVWNFVVQAMTDHLEAMKAISDVFFGWFDTTWEEVWGGIKDFFISVWETIKLVFETHWEFTKALVSGAMNAIKTTITTIWNAIKTTVQNVLNGIKTVITNVWDAIKAYVTTVMGLIKSILETSWNLIKTVVTNVVNAIKTTITNVWDAIKTYVTTVMGLVKSIFETSWNTIKTTVTGIANSIKTSVSSTFDNLKTSMSNAMDTARGNVTSAMQNAKDGVIRVWSNIKETFADIGRNIINGIIDGIGSMVSSLYDSIENALSGLVDKAKDALGIESPSTVMRDEIGKQMPPGIAIGFESAMSRATRDMQNALDDSVSSLHTDDVAVGIQDDMINSISTVADYYGEIENRLAESVSNMRSSLEYLVSAGKTVANVEQIGYVGYNGITQGSSDTNDREGVVQEKKGNTYVFYTSKAIDEKEAARQMMRAERDMAEGFA